MFSPTLLGQFAAFSNQKLIIRLSSTFAVSAQTGHANFAGDLSELF